VAYDKQVEEQIQAQQRAVMQEQTAMAEARQAEQKAITAEKEGQANATKAKWEQEVLKAKAVTQAEQEKEVAELAAQQKREVAKLASEAAEFTKQEQTKLGEGEASRKRAVMAADGALEKKLAAYEEVNKAYAAELGKQRWVPEVQMGGAGSTGSSAVSLIDLLQAKTARDLALDMSVHKQ
jgi:hypothetical protein